ncbi:MAG: hypothetical protein KAH38_01920 [Candidatus Hydrogenedentes bacterium]|nr:hypothetical protein [Candidatus Hydrogenedentota bacterium]
MGKENSRQRFAEAKKMYAEGNYGEALSHLQKLNKQHPGVFNVQYPILQCLQHFGEIGKVRKLHKKMMRDFLEEKDQVKLNKVERWMKRTEEKTIITGGDSKDGQIEDEIEGQIEGEEEQQIEPDDKEAGGNEGKEDVTLKIGNGQSVVKGRHPVLRKLLIAGEVILIVFIGSVMMYLLSTKTTRVLPEFTAAVIVEANKEQTVGKLYLKNANTFRMEIMDQIFIANTGQVRKMLTEEEKYINVNLSAVERYNPLVGLSNFGDWVRMNDAKKVGHEKLQGFACDIYQASVEKSEDSFSVSTKVWYCRQIKFPLKSESTTSRSEGKLSVTLKNIQMNTSLSSQIFEVPSVYAEFVKKEDEEEERRRLEALPDNMEAFLQGGDAAALLDQF